MDLKGQVGIKSKIYSMALTPEQVRDFKETIGSQVAGNPPTILTAFREPEFELMRTLTFELREVLHAEQEYEFQDAFYDEYDPLKEIEIESRLASVNEKKGRDITLCFMVFETEFRIKPGAPPFATTATTIVLRRKDFK